MKRIANREARCLEAPRLPRAGRSGHQPVVVGVATDPKPQNTIGNLQSERPVGEANTDGSEAANLLEVERGMLGVAFQESEVLIGTPLDQLGQGVIAGPKFRGCDVLHKSEHLPDLKAFSAVSAKGSSLPALASSSS